MSSSQEKFSQNTLQIPITFAIIKNKWFEFFIVLPIEISNLTLWTF